MELGDQLAVVRRRHRLILAVFAIVVAAATVISLILPKVYEAQVALLIGNSTGSVNPSLDQALLSQRLSVTYAQVATQRATLARVVTKLGLNTTPEKLAGQVAASAPQDSSIVTITVRDGQPDRAAIIANAIASDVVASTPSITGQDADLRTFIAESLATTRSQLTETQGRVDDLSALTARTPAQDVLLATLQNRLTSLQATFATLLSLASSASANLATVTDPAVAPLSPTAPNVPLNVILGAVGGLLLGIGAAFVAEQLDDSVKTAADVHEACGLATIGSIGQSRIDPKKEKIYWLVTLLYPRAAVAESFRSLRTSLQFASIDQDVQTLLVTSPLPGDGKTTIAANLAVAFALAGRRTILVDADLRRPTVHQVFGLSGESGLTNLLRSDPTRVSQELRATEVPNLQILPCGAIPPNPAEILGSQRMGAVLDGLRSVADIVVLDSAPLQVVTDASVLAARVDATLVVAMSGSTSRGALRRGTESLRRSHAHIVGVVLNRVPRQAADLYSSYYRHDETVPPEPASPATMVAEPSSDHGVR